MNSQNLSSLNPESLSAQATHWQSWLDVEAALARAQASIGMIPEWAAETITENATLERVGEEALRASIKQTMAPVMSLTRLLAERSGKAGDYVHWGATTQNVMQTGRLLVLRRVHNHLLTDLARTLTRLSEMAEEHAETPMAGRTNRRHALPITFGFKVAGWIEELTRAIERLNEIRDRVFRLPFGGAVGAMHAYGNQGKEVCSALASELELDELLVPGRAVNDLFIEYIVGISLLAMSIERVAQELYLLMEEEISEVSETLNDQVIGSSTMPHKVNPKCVVKVIATCARLRALAAPAMEAGKPSHEGDSASNSLLSSILDDASRLGCELTTRFADLMELIEVNSDRMLENLALTGEALASENLMMGLASKVGRSRAHDIVHEVIINSQGKDIGSALANAPEITGEIDSAAIRKLLDFRQYTGDSAKISRQAAALGRQISGTLETSSDNLQTLGRRRVL